MLQHSKGKLFPLGCILCALVLLAAALGIACTPAAPEAAPSTPADTAESAAEAADAAGRAEAADAAGRAEAEPVLLSLALPSETQADDLLLAQICFSGSGAVSIEPGSGWTLILQSSNESGIGLASFCKVVRDPSAEPALYPFQITANGTKGAQTQISGKILVIRGIDPANPFGTYTSGSGSGTDLIAAGFDAQEPVIIVTLFGITDNTDGLTASGDTEGLQTLYNELADGGFVLYASQQASDSGTVGNQKSTAGQSGDWASQRIAFRLAPVEVSFLAGDQGSLTAEHLQKVSFTAVGHIAQEQVPQVVANFGFTFAGWLPKGGEKALNPEEVSKLALSGGAEFTAQYQKATYTVRFELGDHGASKDPLVLRNLNYGDAVNVPNVTANAGWTFDGWDRTPSATVKGDATYTALYTAANYSVEFVLGEHGSSTDTLLYTGLAAGDVISIPGVTPSEGWTFDGWDVTPATTVSGDATYIAQYSLTTYTITFNLDGKGMSEDTLVFSGMAIGDPITIPTVIGNSGWRFKGWDAEIPDTVEGDATFTALYDVFRPK